MECSNFEVLSRCMPSQSVFADAPSWGSLAAADSFNCFDRGYGEAGVNVVEPLQLNAGDVGERLYIMTQKATLIPTHELFA